MEGSRFDKLRLTVECYTVVALLTFILIIISRPIPSPAHSFISGLKPPLSANPSHRNLPFLARTGRLLLFHIANYIFFKSQGYLAERRAHFSVAG